jgi:hypothetical protein
VWGRISVLAPAELVYDFDGDGGDDLLFQRTSDNNLFVYNGEGGLQHLFAVKPPVEALGDLNGDGIVDVVTRSGVDRVQTFTAAQPGIFVDFGPRTDQATVALADFDGDGGQDILFQRNDGALFVYNGEGGLQYNFGVKPTLEAVGDIDGDGKADIIVRFATDRVSAFTSTSGGILVDYGPRAGQELIALGDFDGDGGLDLLFQRTSDGLLLAIDGNGGLQHNFGLVANGGVLGVGDIDGDGQDDIIVDTGSSVVAMSSAAGGVAATFALAPDLELVAMADFDGDGSDELLFQRASDGLTGVFDGDGSLQYSFGIKPTNIEMVGDLNNDGAVDVVFRTAADRVQAYTTQVGGILTDFGPRAGQDLIGALPDLLDLGFSAII